MREVKKDQHVIACIESPASAETVIAYARHCAHMLNDKGIALLNVSKEGGGEWLKQYGLPYMGLKGEWSTAIEGLPTALGGILVVTAVSHKAPRSSITHPGTLLRTFGRCKSAWLVVDGDGGLPSPTPAEGGFPATTAITLDHRRESKEKLIWGSYMARFLHSRLTIATPTYKDAGLRQRLDNNMRYIEKIYRPLGVEYSTVALESTTFGNPDMAAIERLRPELLIAMTSDPRDRDVVDWIVRRPERRLLERRPYTPLLFLNQRDDLYILCD